MTTGGPSRQPRVLLFDRNLVNPYTCEFAEALAAQGVDVRIAGPTNALVDAIGAYPRSGVRGHAVVKAVDCVRGVVRLVGALRLFRPQIAHFQWLGPFDKLFASLMFRLGVPTVYTAHNPEARGRSGRVRQEWMLRRAAAILVHGPSLRDELIAAHPTLAPRVHVIRHGSYARSVVLTSREAAREALGLPAEAIVYAFVGQLTRRKGADLLVKAFSRIAVEKPNARLIVAGPLVDRGHLDEIRSLASDVDDQVRWIVSEDHLPQETLDIVISSANQVVLPFREASQSGSVIYAMTHGRCVVSTRCGEVAAVVDERGLLVEPGDVSALTEAMRLACTTPARCDELGVEARRYAVEDLSWSKTAQEVAEIYAEILAGETHVDVVEALS